MQVESMLLLNIVNNKNRAVDPHSSFADPNSAVFLLADSDPAAFSMQTRLSSKHF